MTLADKLKSTFDNCIVFLKGEEPKSKSQIPLYTKEEIKKLYGIKKDIEKFPKKAEEY